MRGIGIYITAVLLICMTRMTVQAAGSNCVKSTEGKDFWFGFMENRLVLDCGIPISQNYLEITVTSRFVCNYTLSLGKSATPFDTGTLLPGVPKKIRIDRTKAEPYGSETVEEKGLHLVSDQPLNLYAMNFSVNSVDAAVIFPVEALGKEYFAMCYEPHVEVRAEPCGYFFNGKNSEFVVVATEDNTLVTITPNKVTDKLKPAGVPFTITLNRGELYQVQSMNNYILPGQGDLTGSYIQSDKPVALYSGAWATTVPVTSLNAWDHLYEQIPPVRSWGRKFVAVPLKTRLKDTYRILASTNQTTVRVGSKTPVLLDRGKFMEFMLEENEPSLIESDHPVLLVQYSNSNDVDKPASVPYALWNGDGDPSMFVIGPTDQTREDVTFVAYDTDEITSKIFVNIIAADDAAPQIRLDGQPVAFTTIPTAGYSYAREQITPGTHNISTLVTGKGFIAYVYGFGGVESYGYGVGFNLTTHLDLGGDIRFASDTLLLCNGETRTLDAGPGFQSFLWKPGNQTTQSITVSTAGYYEVTATTDDGCVLTDAIRVIESRPVVNLGRDTTICSNKSFVLDATRGFTAWKWSTGETTGAITPGSTGKYSVLATDRYGCQARDTVQVTVVSPPVIDFSRLDTLVCGSKSTVFNVTSDKGSLSLGSSVPGVTIQNLAVTVPGYGTYPFTISAVEESGCRSEIAVAIGFHKNPSATFNLNANTCYAIPVEAVYQGDANVRTSSFSWVFGGDNLANGIGKDRVMIDFPESRVNRSLSLTVTDQGCSASSSITGIRSLEKMSVLLSDTVICAGLPVHAQATGISGTSVFTWDWGDGTVEHPGANASHTYASVGKFSIRVSSTESTGCVSPALNVPVVRVKPAAIAGFTVNRNILCLPDTLVLKASDKTPGNRYSWRFGDGAQASDSVVRHRYNREGKYDIFLRVTTLQGCSDSLLKKELVTVATVPTTGFSLPDNQCLPAGVQVLGYTGSGSSTDTYRWNLGSLQADEIIRSPGNSAGPLEFDLKHRPQVTISLEVVSQVGCSAGPRQILLKRQPIFSASASPVSGCPPLPVNFGATLADTVDRVGFRWDFGDESAGTGASVTHTYRDAGVARDVRVWATSTLTGCSDSLVRAKWITVFPVPNAGFTIDNPQLCLPDTFVFRALDTTTGNRYAWRMGDGGLAAASLVRHHYAKDGKYDIFLRVTNQQGCSDSLFRKEMVFAAPVPSAGFSLSDNQCLPAGTQSLRYTGSGTPADTYRWNLDGLQPDEILRNPGNSAGPFEYDLKHKPQVTVSLQVISQFGCTVGPRQLLLKRKPVFTVAASAISGCPPFDVQFRVSPADTVDRVGYSWNFGDGNPATGSAVTHTFRAPAGFRDVHIVAASSLTGCTDSLVKPGWIKVFSIPGAGFTADKTQLCLPDTFVIKALDTSPGNRYAWRLGDGSLADGTTVRHRYALDGKYDLFLQVTNPQGCTDSLLRKEWVFAAPVPTIGFSPDLSGCLEPGPHSLGYVGSATRADQYLWNLSAFLPDEVTKSPGNSPGPMEFSLTSQPMASVSLQVISSFGCKSETKSLVLKQKPKVLIQPSAISGCIPLRVNFSAAGANPGDRISYLWNFGDGASQAGQSVQHTYPLPDHAWDVSLKGVSGITGCPDSLLIRNAVTVFPNPVAGFTVDRQTVYNDHPDIQLTNLSTGADETAWDFGDGTMSFVENPLHTFTSVGHKKILQTVTNSFGCSDSTSTNILVALGRIYTPNAFSPNARNQVDREFSPFARGIAEKGYHMVIYSRWNDKVFETRNQVRAWDGSLPGGTMAPPGTYLWILEFTDVLGMDHRQTGTVTLLY